MKANRPSFLSTSFLNNLSAFSLIGAAFSVWFQKSPGGCGDYPQNFEVLFIGVGIGAVSALLFYILYPRIPNAFVAQPVLLTVVRYYLASMLLSYGFAKVFTSQFPHLMANMDARMIELSPMRVAWSFFGYSRGYQMFLGWAEVVPGILLLFRRTTLMGALLSFIVMLNVFLINIFFDVCVKLNSGIYAILSLYVLLQYTPRLWAFFFTHQAIPTQHVPAIETRWLKITGRVLNYIALAYILWTAGDGAWQTYHYAHTHVVQTPVQGPWKSSSILHWSGSEWRQKNVTDSLYASRIFFDGYNGVIKSDFIRDRFRFSLDSGNNLLTVNFTNSRNEWNIAPVKWKYEKIHPDTLNLWIKWKKDSLQIKCSLRKEQLTRY